MHLRRSYTVTACSVLGAGMVLFALVYANNPITLAQEVVVDSERSGIAPPEVVRSEEEWRDKLSQDAYYVLREKGTERPFTNKYDKHFEPGAYACAGCGQLLFESRTKFNSGCGWPAFYAAKSGERVNLTPDLSFGMSRTEVTCARCGSHLGHVFEDAPQTPTGQRYCINSVSLKFIPAEQLARIATGTSTVSVRPTNVDSPRSSEPGR